MSNIRYEDVPNLSPPPPVAATAPPPTVAPTQALTIPQPGIVYVESPGGGIMPSPAVTPTTPPPSTSLNVGALLTGIVNPPDTSVNVGALLTGIVNPPEEAVPLTHSQTPSDEDETDLPDLDGIELFGNPPLRGMEFVQYVRRGCNARNMDDLPVFANAIAEGIHGGMGDGGTSFGPWNMHQGGKLPKKYWNRPPKDPATQIWTWTPQGIDWALNLMAKEGVPGLHGHAAVHRIVEQFEIPSNIGGQEVVRDDIYDQLAKMGDPYGFLAAQAAGPSLSGVTAPPITTPPAKSGVGAKGRWQDFIEVLYKGLPKTQDRLAAQGEALREVFR